MYFHVNMLIWDHWRLKYTKVQSQQMAFTQSPSLSNSPMIFTNYLICTVLLDHCSNLQVVPCQIQMWDLWKKFAWGGGLAFSKRVLAICEYICLSIKVTLFRGQGGVTCGAIEEASRSSKAIDERVIIHFRGRNAIIAHFRDENYDIDSHSILSIAIISYQ